MPGINKNIIGQAPVGYAFPTGTDPVMLDICLAYIAGEPLGIRAKNHEPVPSFWGVDKEGNPTEDAAELMRGVKYPIGEHKGFGLAILEELLTGVFSGGAILDDKDDGPSRYTETTHTAIAIRTDALMPESEYLKRSDELVERLRAQDEKVHIPGDSAWSHIRNAEEKGYTELDPETVEAFNRYARKYGTKEFPLS